MTDYEIFQEDRADCGPACLVIAARLLGRELDLAVLKSLFPTPVSGMNLVQLLSIGEQVGLQCRASRLEAEDIDALSCPAILHFGVFHFVVLERLEASGHAWIIDPAMGRVRLTSNHIASRFSGIAIEVEASENQLDVHPMPRLSPLVVLASLPNSTLRLVALLTAALCSQIGLFLFPLYIKFIVEIVLIPRDVSMLVAALLAALVALAVVIVFRVVKRHLLDEAIRDIDTALARYLNHLVLRCNYGVFARKAPGTIMRYFASVREIRKLMSQGFLDAAVDLLTLAVLVILCAVLAPLFGLAIGAISIGYVWLQLHLARRRRPVLRRSSITEAQETTVLRENLRNLQAIKTCGYERQRDLIWQTAYRRAAMGTDRLRALEGQAETVSELMLTGSRFVMVALAAWLALAHDLSVGTVFALAFYVSLTTMTLSTLMRNVVRIWDIDLYLRDLSILALEPSDPMSVFASRRADGEGPQRCSGAPILDLRDVSFRYEIGRQRVLRHVDLTLSAGEIVALTGPSGAGKSTVLKLALGLFDPERGEVLLHGHRVTLYSRDACALHLATVMQEDQLFSGTILQNITGFDPAPDIERATRACKIACAVEIVESANGGLFSQIFPGGELFSTGEKQRIFLARALYGGASTLLLDEFTGNVDQATETAIFVNLRREEKTVLMTAHRESTIAQADRVLRILPESRTIEVAP